MYILSLIPAILLSATEGGGLKYVSHKRSYEGARMYCQSVYGTDLAPIIDRNTAIWEINTRNDDEVNSQVWFDLYSGGNEARCAYFDADSDTIFDNIDCSLTKPFLCAAKESLPSYNPGQYVLISGGQFGDGLSFEEAQQTCRSQYGTDLATVRTEADASAAAELIQPAVNGFPNAIIGLHDVGTEGVFEWIDGTACTTTDGRCTELFQNNHYLQANGLDNVGDIDNLENADCIALNTFVLEEYYNLDGSNFLEMGCDNPMGVEYNILCNAPQSNGLAAKPSNENVLSDASYNGNYVFISGGNYGDGLSFDGAQAKCKSEYGTDLATIVNENDAIAAGQVMADNGIIMGCDGCWPYAIIGLNEIDIEGQYAWKDGTECTANDNGKCIPDLFNIHYYDTDDYDDFSLNPGAHCIVFNGYDNGKKLDGSNFFEMECANPFGMQHNILCNAPSE